MKNISVICKANKTETLFYMRHVCLLIQDTARTSSAAGYLGLPRYTTVCNMHSRTSVGLLRPGIIKAYSVAGEITRMSKKMGQTGNFSDYVPLLIEGFSYSCILPKLHSKWIKRKGHSPYEKDR